MTVKAYSLKADGAKQVASDFRVREFACPGTDAVWVDTDLAALLQRVRLHFGKPVSVTSGYRTVAHNAKVGGSPTSQHLSGTAADIAIAGVDPIEICRYAEWQMRTSGGIGVYKSHAHLDARGSRARWDMRSGSYEAVSGFPGYAPDDKPDSVPVVLKCRCGASIGTVQGIMVDGSVYAPVRAVCTALGHTVEWDGKTATVT